MKRFEVEINDSKDEITSIDLSNDEKANINGKEQSYEFRFMNDNSLTVRINNRNYFLLAEKNTDDDTISITIDSETFKADCKSELDILVEKLSDGKKQGKTKKEIRSPMPGIIKALNVTSGQVVKKGEVMLVLEAMKMENEIKAQTDGTVKSINISPLSSVEKNELLLVFE